MIVAIRNLWGREPAILLTLIPLVFEIFRVIELDVPIEQGAVTMLVEAIIGVAIRSRVTPAANAWPATEFRRDSRKPVR